MNSASFKHFLDCHDNKAGWGSENNFRRLYEGIAVSTVDIRFFQLCPG